MLAISSFKLFVFLTVIGAVCLHAKIEHHIHLPDGGPILPRSLDSLSSGMQKRFIPMKVEMMACQDDGSGAKCKYGARLMDGEPFLNSAVQAAADAPFSDEWKDSHDDGDPY